MGYIPYNQYRRSYNIVPPRAAAIGAGTAAGGYRGGSGYRQARGSPRIMVEEERGFMADLRSLFGAPEHCLEGNVQYSCTLAPVCWLTGGVVTEGIAGAPYKTSLGLFCTVYSMVHSYLTIS
jgi:hypothetical protein